MGTDTFFRDAHLCSRSHGPARKKAVCPIFSTARTPACGTAQSVDCNLRLSVPFFRQPLRTPASLSTATACCQAPHELSARDSGSPLKMGTDTFFRDAHL